MPYIPFDARETLLSYAGRLAQVHTGAGIGRLLADLRVPVEKFVLGHMQAIQIFSQATGSDFDILKQAALTGMKTQIAFRGSNMAKSFVSRQANKYCPDCLREDGCSASWRQQLIWCFAPVHRCLHHGVELCKLPEPALDLRDCLVDARVPTATCLEGETPEFLSWLDDRLYREVDVDTWMIDQTIQQVLGSSMMLGAVLEHGHKVRPHRLPAAVQEEITDIGFSIYREGPQAVTEALDAIRASSPATAVQAGPLAMYGTLFDWLDRRCNALDPGPIRDLLREHIVKHDVLSRGDKILGSEIEERRFHSVQSLAEETGINRPRMARLLKKLGQIPREATDAESGVMRFEACEIAGLIRDFETAVEMKDAPVYIGASKSQFQAIYASGLIEPLIPRDAPGAIRRVVFSRRHLDDFIAQMERLPLAGRNCDQLVSISDACQRGAGTTIPVLRRILTGDLPAWRREGSVGLAKILILRPAMAGAG